MPDVVRQVDYFYVLVPDKPGEGHRVLSGLKQEGVNLLAQLGFPSGRGKTQVDLVPENTEVLKRAARKLGLKLSARKRAFLIQGDDRVGAVADMLARLAGQKINVTASQAVAAGAGRWGMVLWVKPADARKAAKVLGAGGTS